jgi:sulfate adenylyltransferase
MVYDDFKSVIDDMRLSNDLPWTIPIVLDVEGEGIRFGEGDDIALFYRDKPLAIMKVEDIYSYDKSEFSEKVFGTKDLNHPGVAKVYSMKDKLIGGKIDLLNRPETDFPQYKLYPKETHVLFDARGWRTIVGFRTRNVPHIGHEYIQKTALTFFDGLFINPLIGKKKRGDFTDEAILGAYRILIDKYFPKNNAVLAILETWMRYAGPREAIFHAIIRKNYGCTHFIVGRDHAGVGNYYGPYEAHDIFGEFPDLGITPLFFKTFYYCEICEGIVNDRICPHPEDKHLYFSGTMIRNMISNGEYPPEKIMRREVATYLMKLQHKFVE